MTATDPSAPRSEPVEDGACLPIPSRLAEFELQRVLGIGGFGIVYLAHDTSLGRRVAIKEYMPAALATRRGTTEVAVRSERHRETFDAGLKSFVNEARLLAQFDHPALVKVFRFWEAHGTAYMVMPFIEGITLKDRLRALPAPPDEDWLRALLAPLTEALQVLHARQCYHRDIAPDNIILLAGSGRPLLLDFGAARRVIGDMTQALTVILKPGYAPLEQYAEVAHMRQGPWTDVYALAAVVYHAISGRTPPVAVARVLSDTCTPLAELAAGRYGAGFLQAIDRALAVRPEERTPDIAQLRAELGLQARPVVDEDATLRLVADPMAPPPAEDRPRDRSPAGGAPPGLPSGNPPGLPSGAPPGRPPAALDPRTIATSDPSTSDQAGATITATTFPPTVMAGAPGAGTSEVADDVTVRVPAPTAFAPTAFQPRTDREEAAPAQDALPPADPPAPAAATPAPSMAPVAADDTPRSAASGPRTGLWLGAVLLLATAAGAALLTARRDGATTPATPLTTPPVTVAQTSATGPALAAAEVGTARSSAPAPVQASAGAAAPASAPATAPTTARTPEQAPTPSPARTPSDMPAAGSRATSSPFDAVRAFDQVLAGADAGWALQLTPPARALSVSRRDRLRFTLRSARDGYYHVLMRDADGSLALVLPNSRARDHRIRAGQSVELPPTGSPLEASEPLGAADILVVVSDRPRNFEALGGHRVSSFWLLPDAAALARLDAQRAPGRGPLLSAAPADCAEPACAGYGAARFTLQVIR